jgi:hypothetical protein
MNTLFHGANPRVLHLSTDLGVRSLKLPTDNLRSGGAKEHGAFKIVNCRIL